MTLSARQSPQQKRIHGPEQYFAAFRPLAQSPNPIQQMLQLRPRKVRIDYQSGLRADQLFVPSTAQFFANRRGHTTLPHDGIRQRLSCRAVPHDRRLALVGDADRGDLSRRSSRAAQHLTRDLQLRIPYRLGVVLHLPRRGINLLELRLRNCRRRSQTVEKDGSARSRSLIQSENVSL